MRQLDAIIVLAPSVKQQEIVDLLTAGVTPLMHLLLLDKVARESDFVGARVALAAECAFLYRVAARLNSACFDTAVVGALPASYDTAKWQAALAAFVSSLAARLDAASAGSGNADTNPVAARTLAELHEQEDAMVADSRSLKKSTSAYEAKRLAFRTALYGETGVDSRARAARIWFGVVAVLMVASVGVAAGMMAMDKEKEASVAAAAVVALILAYAAWSALQR
jgi:hypothetical protein